MDRITAIVFFVLLVGLVGCGAKSSSGDQSQKIKSPSSDTVSLDGSYGTLSYKGVVERSIEGTNCKYTIKEIHFKYHVFGSINSTTKIPVTIEMVATIAPPSGTGSWDRIFEKAYPTTEVLTFTSPNATITNLTFIIPTDIVHKADHLGLDVTDGTMLWPIAEELKAEPDTPVNASRPIGQATNSSTSAH